MSDMAGKIGLIVGVANKRSLSWAIAQAAAEAGATLVLTYQGRFEEHVGELADTLTPRPLVLPLDVQNDAEIDAVFARIQQEHGGLDFLVHGVAFANRDDITNPFVQTSREGFRLALDISAYSLIALARGAQPLMEARGGGSIVTLTYLGQHARLSQLQRDGCRQGGARSVGSLSRRRPRSAEHPCQRHLRRSDQDARGRRHRRLLEYPRRRPRTRAARRTIEASEVADAAVFLLSSAGRGVTGEVLMVDSGYHVLGM